MKKENTLRVEIPLLLPTVENEQDQCVERLLERMRFHKGIQQAHVEREDHKANLCLHYDPALVSLNQVRRWTNKEGAAVTSPNRHERRIVMQAQIRFVV